MRRRREPSGLIDQIDGHGESLQYRISPPGARVRGSAAAVTVASSAATTTKSAARPSIDLLPRVAVCGSRSGDELDFAGLDRAAVHEQAAAPVEATADAFDPVDAHAAPAEEVARADPVEDRVQAAGRPGVVMPFEPRQEVGKQRRTLALDAVD